MWYSDKFWTDVCNVEIRGRQNAKLTAEGHGCRAKDELQETLSETSSAEYNQRYLIPAKRKSKSNFIPLKNVYV